MSIMEFGDRNLNYVRLKLIGSGIEEPPRMLASETFHFNVGYTRSSSSQRRRPPENDEGFRLCQS